MSDREKLIELWETAEKRFVDFCRGQDNCKSCPYNKYGFKCSRAYIIANLISNSVTVQKWIPVSERLPEYSGEYQVVNVARYSRVFEDMPQTLTYVTVAFFDYDQKIWKMSDNTLNALIKEEDRPEEGDFIAYWKPLSKPPKECE